MTARLLLAVAALAMACASAAAARDLTVASRGGPLAEAQRAAYFKPFTEATGIAVQEESWPGGLDALRARSKDPASGWDVVLLRGDELLAACDEGLLERVDWSAAGGKDHYLPAGVADCGVGAFAHSLVLAWDRDKSPATPTWADFWDVAKYPGKRGLGRGPRGNLEIALLADGVAPADVYKTLRTADGVERAFRKLDQIRPYAVWWDHPADAVRILASGEVLMTSADNGLLAAAGRDQHRSFGIQWAGSLLSVQSWAVVKGSPNLRQAYQLLYFMGDAAIEARFAGLLPYPGLAKGALEGLPAETASALPLAPANLQGALMTDEAFWRDNQDRLSQRFAAWLAR